MSIQGQVISAAPEALEATLPPEIAFLSRHGIAADILRQAAGTAATVGASADVTALKCGLVDEVIFYKALASELGLPFLTKIQVADQARYPESILSGVAPLAPALGSACYAAAPTGLSVIRLLGSRPKVASGLVITTPTCLLQGVLDARPRTIAWHAANELPASKPEWSAKDGGSWAQIGWAAIASGGLSVSATLAPSATLSAGMVLSSVIFLGMVVLRMAAARERVATEPLYDAGRYEDRDLPVYTVIVALYRERRILARLVEAITAIDYPPPKLDVKFVIEADDDEMRHALEVMRLPPFFEIVVAPPGEPRTKPRALNVALPLSRGDIVAIYDAEDVPHPNQLRLAVQTFARVPLNVGCLQARLVIDNTEDNWLTRFFTIEYAALFDVINPGLARLDMPVPLGGTSNHFRRSALQRLRGWDAWNVTEDADLGIRLVLAGYRVGDLPSSTLEEAPANLGAWMRQRTRWMKGFMQVCVTHSRQPLRGLRSLGPARFFGAVTMTFGTVAAALGYPFFTVLSVKGLVDRSLFKAETPFEVMTAALGIILFGAGFVAIFAPALVGVARRGWWGLLPYVALLPLYYILISWAAWRGIAELFFARFRWNKTEHGLARTSRTGLLRDAGEAPAPPPPEDG